MARPRLFSAGLPRFSRTKVEEFLKCARCFWLNVREGVPPPPGLPFSLNVAVDHLLKNEFDLFRVSQQVPSRLAREGLAFVPTAHPQIDEWRSNFKGVAAPRPDLGMELFGAIDDLWHDRNGTHYVVDYKATAKKDEVSLDADWQSGYRRQVEFYQWLLRANGLTVSNDAYFVYANGIKDDAPFDDLLRFRTRILKYTGDDSWVERTLLDLRETLARTEPPTPAASCALCDYVRKVRLWA
jgi:hypothetical protein